MISKEQIVEMVQRYGIGVTFAEKGQGGFVFDETKQIYKTLGDVKSRLFLFDQKKQGMI